MNNLFLLCRVLIFLCPAFVFCAPETVRAAQGGVRPIALGGAFVAVADDAHGASWNPAGIAWQEKCEVTYSGVLNARDDYILSDFISDDYFAYVQPLRAGYRKEFKSYGAVGVFFNHAGYKVEGAKVTIYQPGIAYGVPVGETASLGISAGYYMFDAKVPSLGSSDETLTFSLGALWYWTDTVTLGCTVENITEPSFTIFGVSDKLIRVVRPGIAYYWGKNTILSCEIYDLFGNTSGRAADYSRNLRFGVEHYLTGEIALRAGAHHLNSKVDESKYLSAGLGWQRAEFFHITPVTYYLDYTLTYWLDSPPGMNDYTHQLGVTVKF